MAALAYTKQKISLGFMNSFTPIHREMQARGDGKLKSICRFIDQLFCLHQSTIVLTKMEGKQALAFSDTRHKNYWLSGMKVVGFAALCFTAYKKAQFRMPIAAAFLIIAFAKTYSRWGLDAFHLDADKLQNETEAFLLDFIKCRWGDDIKNSEPPTVEHFAYDMKVLQLLSETMGVTFLKNTDENGAREAVLAVYKKIADKELSGTNKDYIRLMTSWILWQHAGLFLRKMKVDIPDISLYKFDQKVKEMHRNQANQNPNGKSIRDFLNQLYNYIFEKDIEDPFQAGNYVKRRIVSPTNTNKPTVELLIFAFNRSRHLLKLDVSVSSLYRIYFLQQLFDNNVTKAVFKSPDEKESTQYDHLVADLQKRRNEMEAKLFPWLFF